MSKYIKELFTFSVMPNNVRNRYVLNNRKLRKWGRSDKLSVVNIIFSGVFGLTALSLSVKGCYDSKQMAEQGQKVKNFNSLLDNTTTTNRDLEKQISTLNGLLSVANQNRLNDSMSNKVRLNISIDRFYDLLRGISFRWVAENEGLDDLTIAFMQSVESEINEDLKNPAATQNKNFNSLLLDSKNHIIRCFDFDKRQKDLQDIPDSLKYHFTALFRFYDSSIRVEKLASYQSVIDIVNYEPKKKIYHGSTKKDK